MRVFVSKLRAKASNLFTGLLTPVLALAGAALLSYGAYMIYHPAAFIVGGLLVIYAAYDSSR